MRSDDDRSPHTAVDAKGPGTPPGSDREDDAGDDRARIERLADAYRRDSESLRANGPSVRLLERLCAVEEALRGAGEDPDGLVRDLY